jgi:hypothetical protein
MSMGQIEASPNLSMGAIRQTEYTSDGFRNTLVGSASSMADLGMSSTRAAVDYHQMTQQAIQKASQEVDTAVKTSAKSYAEATASVLEQFVAAAKAKSVDEQSLKNYLRATGLNDIDQLSRTYNNLADLYKQGNLGATVGAGINIGSVGSPFHVNANLAGSAQTGIRTSNAAGVTFNTNKNQGEVFNREEAYHIADSLAARGDNGLKAALDQQKRAEQSYSAALNRQKSFSESVSKMNSDSLGSSFKLDFEGYLRSRYGEQNTREILRNPVEAKRYQEDYVDSLSKQILNRVDVGSREQVFEADRQNKASIAGQDAVQSDYAGNEAKVKNQQEAWQASTDKHPDSSVKDEVDRKLDKTPLIEDPKVQQLMKEAPVGSLAGNREEAQKEEAKKDQNLSVPERWAGFFSD